MKLPATIAVGLLCLAGLTGCEGGAEEAGEDIDDATEEVGEGLEEAGDEIEDAFDD